MSDALSRRDVLKTMAAGCLAALPGPAEAGPFHAGGSAEDGWITGHMTGAQALVEALRRECVACVYGIPGAQDNELWDTMKSKGLPYLLATHEYSAAVMADGYARSTGKPGVLCVVPGPGVTNALTGIGEALLDSVPMVCIVCDVARGPKAHPFQVHELAQVPLLEHLTKKVFALTDACDIPAAVFEAFALAVSGEPGPVAVNVPYNLLIEACKYHCPPPALPGLPFDETAFTCALGLLANQKLQVGIYAGLGCMDFAHDLEQVANLLQAPVATSVSGKGVISECHPLAVGWGYGPQGTKTAEEIFKCVDLVLAIGVRFSEVSTALYSIPPHCPLVHVDANPNNLGKAVKAQVCVNADAGLFLARVLEQGDLVRRPANDKLVARIKALKAEDHKRHGHVYPVCAVDPMTFLLALRECTEPDALVFVDVTQAEHWAAEAFTVTQPRTYFNPTDNQSMGWSIPAALGAQRVHPGRQVVTITGDGCFLFSAIEMSTAAREGLPVKFFVLDDQAYHYMQTLQKAAYRRTTATLLAKLDYAALARALGVGYNEILTCDGLDAAIRGSLSQDGPVLTRVAVDYGKRPVRWIEATRRRYTKELTTDEKVRFAARMGARALHVKADND